jgi:site-specific DNA recombinase
MRVALYARYSSEHQKESSITDQFRNCETRAAREGWTITARYEDKAISGTTSERPGYQQLLADAKAKQFDIVLVDDFSRLSRDAQEAEQTRKRFIYWGVRLIGVSDGIDTATKGHKMMAGFKGIMNEQFIDDMRDKIARGMQGQAMKGFHCGGRIYGYNLVPELHPTKTDPYGQPERIGTKLAINPDQAKWVRWIFERYAEGQSPLKIVSELNRQQIPAPGAAYQRHYRRTPTWSAAALHGDLTKGTGLLNNPLYVGRYVWNRSRREKDPDTNRRSHVVRDQSEWIETPAPHLRIIDEDLWGRVKARRAEVSLGVAALRASLHCRARSTGAGPKYLFSGCWSAGNVGGNSSFARRPNTPVAPGGPVGRRSVRTRLKSHASWSSRSCSRRSRKICSPKRAWRCSSKKWRACSPINDGHGGPTSRRRRHACRKSSGKSTTS